MQKEMETKGLTEISTTDPDARMMATNNNDVDVCYNVQLAVDAKHSLVVDCDVINNPSDHGQLSIMGKRARRVLRMKNRRLKVLADKGYYSTKEIITCENSKLTIYVPQQKYSSRKEKEFEIENFKYDASEDVYYCPAGQKLYSSGSCSRVENGVEYIKYRNSRACKECELKDRCTKRRNGRVIFRSADQEILDRIDKRLKNNKQLYQKRQMIVEHPFGTIKRQWGFSYFLTRGLKSVKTEAALMFLAYNIKRVLNILGIQGMIGRLSVA